MYIIHNYTRNMYIIPYNIYAVYDSKNNMIYIYGRYNYVIYNFAHLDMFKTRIRYVLFTFHLIEIQLNASISYVLQYVYLDFFSYIVHTGYVLICMVSSLGK